MSDPESIVHERKLTLCPTTADWPVPELLKVCPECNDFLLHCCGCNNRNLDLPWHRRPAKPCHHYRVVFTDGACTNNGLPEAKAGAGVAYGNDEDSQLSTPITNMIDNFHCGRTNERNFVQQSWVWSFSRREKILKAKLKFGSSQPTLSMLLRA
jgi:ribonuclease HI